jgi:tRNA modification GTPase
MQQQDTICALATPSGDGAVGIVRLSGSRAAELLERAARGVTLRPRRMVRVDLFDPESDAALDQVLVCLMRAPRSYTGEDVVEIYGHGGRLNMEALLGLFVRLGARPAGPGEFTRRAFLNGRLDLTQAEAVAEVIAARGARALRNAHAVLGGALGREVRAVRAQAVALAAELEACVDFAEELGDGGVGEGLAERHRALLAQLGRLVASYRRGRRLNGVSAVLVGAVNAGKSSLFNRLLGSRRALVSAEPGTTRDYLEAEVEWDGLRVTLIDTAGDRERERMSVLEREGLALALERARTADVVVQVIDVSVAGGAGAGESAAGGVGRVVVAHKVDLLAGELRRQRCRALAAGAGGVGVVEASAATGEGLEALRAAVVAAALGDAAEGGGEGLGESRETVQVTQERQWEALRRAELALGAGLTALSEGTAPELVVEHTREALVALGEITGETFTEDVLDAVFARFCVGK